MIGALVATAALAAAVRADAPGAASLKSSSATAAKIASLLPGEPAGGVLGEADGAIPDGTTVFDAHVPGVGKLDPQLALALRGAAADASSVGVQFVVDSGWRTKAYQAELFREAVAKYGSKAEAARWVASPDRSVHVSGQAVDLGGAAAAMWLASYGAAYGLCQIYDNEPWHYELRPDAVGHGCPPTYADPTHDPRLQP